MATNFEYISSVGALPVNLGRQQYGPLDGSSVFKSIVDLKYYILASRNPTAVSSLSETSAIYENASDYWKKIATRYAYVGQNVTVVDDSGVNNYKIVNVPTLEEISVVMSNDISAEPNPKMFKKIADMESVDDITDALSNAISSKIYFNDYGTEKYGDLSVIKLGAEEYAQLLDLSATNKQAIYIVSSDNKNAYGKKIINLADGSSLSDAVNLKQLTSTASTVSSDLTTTISSVSSELTSDISSISSALSDAISDISSISSALSDAISDISSISSALSDAISAKIFFKEYDEEGKYGDLSVVKIGMQKYAEMCDSDGLNDQTIYIVSSDNVNVYGMKIVNLAEGTSLSDAVNVKQLTSVVSMVSAGLSGDVSELSSNLTSTISSVSSVLSNDLNTKIFFKEYDEEGKYGDLSVIKIGAEEYAELLDLSATNKQAIYIVSSENQDAFGQKIINLADGTSLSDAVNFKQLTSTASTVSSILSDAISVKVQIHDYDNSVRYTDLSIIKMQKDAYDTARVGGLNQDALYMVSSDYIDAYGGQVKNVDDATQDYDAVNLKQLKKKIFIRNYDKSGNELTAFDDLSVLKISIDEYKDLVESDEISALSNSLFVISSNNVDALMQRITNLGDGVDDYDAVNMKQFVRVSSDITSQLTNCLSGYPNLSSVSWNSISLSTLVDMVKFAFSQLGGGQVSY